MPQHSDCAHQERRAHVAEKNALNRKKPARKDDTKKQAKKKKKKKNKSKNKVTGGEFRALYCTSLSTRGVASAARRNSRGIA